MTRWAVVGVHTSIAWPKSDTSVQFRGHQLMLRAATEQHLPAVTFEYPDPISAYDAVLLIRQFLSTLAWVERGYARESGITTGTHPIRIGKSLNLGVVTEQFRQDYLPDPQDPKARLALALYREALGLDNVAYRFLGFFKIINMIRSTGAGQKAWINDTLPRLTDYSAIKRAQELVTESNDVSTYLYESGRCAVAHAYSDPLVDPENMADSERLGRDIDLIRALAEFAIENEFAVKSRHTIWKEHLYHLEGFRTLLGDLVARLKGGEQVGLEQLPRLPRIALRVRDHPQLASFAELTFSPVQIEQGVVWLLGTSPDHVLGVLMGLDLANELLLFEPTKNISITANTGPNGLRAEIDALRLLEQLLRNGQLEVHDIDSGARLGRSDAYVGVNINLTASLASIASNISAIENRLAEG